MRSFQKKPHAFIVLFFFCLVIISHIVLPTFNNGKDWFLFSTWALFVTPPAPVDISWNQGQTFLFRDHQAPAKNAGIDIHSLFFLVKSHNLKMIEELYKTDILKICHCNDLEFVELQGTLYEHIILKKHLTITKRQPL